MPFIKNIEAEDNLYIYLIIVWTMPRLLPEHRLEFEENLRFFMHKTIEIVLLLLEEKINFLV